MDPLDTQKSASKLKNFIVSHLSSSELDEVIMELGFADQNIPPRTAPQHWNAFRNSQSLDKEKTIVGIEAKRIDQPYSDIYVEQPSSCN